MPLDRSPYAVVADRPEAAVALSGQAYVDKDVFAAEQARVFRAGWAPVARISDVARPGDYLSVDLFGAPLVVTNDEGTLRVLSRVCRHRGMPVVQGRGSAKVLTCPYHLWRYDLDGRLAAAPGMERSTVFDRADCALPGMRSEVWGGWVFVNLGGQAPPLAPRLGGAGRTARQDRARPHGHRRCADLPVPLELEGDGGELPGILPPHRTAPGQPAEVQPGPVHL